MTHETSLAFIMGVSAFLHLKINENIKGQEEQNKARRQVIKRAYKELINNDQKIEAYALFRVATEIFMDDYTNLITGGYITRLTDFT